MKFLLFNLLFVVLLVSGCASVSEPHPILSRAGIPVKKSIKTWKEFREQNVVMQKLDYSYGASAIATLMRYYFGDEITEKEVLEDIRSQFCC